MYTALRLDGKSTHQDLAVFVLEEEVAYRAAQTTDMSHTHTHTDKHTCSFVESFRMFS